MLRTLVTTPRFERKIDLLDKRLSHLINRGLERLEGDNLESLFERSQKLYGFSESNLRITKLSSDYCLIFRMADENTIHLVDIVFRNDLSKFIKERK